MEREKKWEGRGKERRRKGKRRKKKGERGGKEEGKEGKKSGTEKKEKKRKKKRKKERKPPPNPLKTTTDKQLQFDTIKEYANVSNYRNYKCERKQLAELCANLLGWLLI